MDSFTGFKSAAGEELPETRAVMDPYARRVPGYRKLDQCRRIQREATGQAGDRLYRGRPPY